MKEINERTVWANERWVWLSERRVCKVMPDLGLLKNPVNVQTDLSEVTCM
jgi:hypothetical protein